MASPNLGIVALTSNELTPEVTINTGTNKLDNAGNKKWPILAVSGDYQLSANDYNSNAVFEFIDEVGSPTLDGPWTLELPSNYRSNFGLKNNTSHTMTVKVLGSSGALTVDLIPSTFGLFNSDTDNIELLAEVAAGATKPYDQYVFINGKPGSSEIVMKASIVRQLFIAASAAGSQGHARTAAADANKAFDFKVNAVSQGTITFNIGSNTPIFTGFNITLNIGDYWELIAPASVDSALDYISLTIIGNRS